MRISLYDSTYSSGTIILMRGIPKASWLDQPNKRSAAAFQSVTRPDASIPTNASLVASMVRLNTVSDSR